MSNIKVKIVNDIKKSDSNKSVMNSFKINTKPIIPDSVNDFRVGSKVKHRHENLFGKILEMDDQKMIIQWNDNTRERIKYSNLNNELEHADELDYVDDIQTQVAPMAPQISKDEESYDKDSMLDKALASLNEEDNEDDINDLQINKSVDLEKIKLQRKVNDLESKLVNKNTQSVKDKIARELVDLKIMKGMIDEDDAEVDVMAIVSMNDEEFEKHRKEVLNYQQDENEVTSASDSIEDINLSDAEKTLKKIKGNGGKGIIGDFSKQTSTMMTTPLGSGEKRSLGEVRDNKISYSNQYTIPDFGDQFADILSDKVEKVAEKQPYIQEKPKQLIGFENLQGLTKPLVTNKAATQFPTNTGIQDLMGNLEWTTISKMH